MTHPHDHNLPEIPVIDTGSDWCLEALQTGSERANALLDAASARYPGFMLKMGDKRSRFWMERYQHPFLNDIDRVAGYIKRPGAHFLNVSYEWGCTSKAAPDPENKCARLVRILDWPDDGLGKFVTAVRIKGKYGDWISLTWPGYVGVLQAVAKGRFAAAINQGPMDLHTGWYAVDWAINRIRMWDTPHIAPAHLLRNVFEYAQTYEEAKYILTNTPIAAPTIFVLSGLTPDQSCVIERKQEDAYVIEGPATAANSWRREGWHGCFRGEENENRIEMMETQTCCFARDFAWLKPPVMNERTRLAMIADATTGKLIAQGFERDGPATQVLRM